MKRHTIKNGIPRISRLRYVPLHLRKKTKKARVPYVEERAKKMSGLEPTVALKNKYHDANHQEKRYTKADLKYDMQGELLKLYQEYDTHNAKWLSEHTAFELENAYESSSIDPSLLSTCESPGYIAKHPHTRLKPCRNMREYTCKHLGTGKGRHCVRTKRHKGTAADLYLPNYDYGEESAKDLSQFLCKRLRLP